MLNTPSPVPTAAALAASAEGAGAKWRQVVVLSVVGDVADACLAFHKCRPNAHTAHPKRDAMVKARMIVPLEIMVSAVSLM